MSWVKEMPALAVSRQWGISDTRLWRIVHHYVNRMLGEIDLSSVTTAGVDETASRPAPCDDRRVAYFQTFTRALRWAVLKGLDNNTLTVKQVAALQELIADRGGATADAWMIKEKLR